MRSSYIVLLNVQSSSKSKALPPSFAGENIFLSQDGRIAKLGDFGLARSLYPSRKEAAAEDQPTPYGEVIPAVAPTPARQFSAQTCLDLSDAVNGAAIVKMFTREVATPNYRAPARADRTSVFDTVLKQNSSAVHFVCSGGDHEPREVRRGA